MKKRFLTLLIAGSLSFSMMSALKPNVVHAGTKTDIISTGLNVIDKLIMPELMKFINRQDAIHGKAKEHLTYIPTIFEKGKFYITALDYDSPNPNQDIYKVKIYNKLNYEKVAERNLKSGQQIAVDISDSRNEYVMEVYTIYNGNDVRKLTSVNLSQEEVKKGQRGMALSKVGNDASHFYWLSPETGEKYNEKLLEKYTNYNGGNVPIYYSNLEWQRIKYNQLDKNNPKENNYRYLCKTKTAAVIGNSLVNNIYFKNAENSKILEKWSKGQEGILYKEPQFGNDKFEITAFDYSNSKNTSFIVKEINPRNPLDMKEYKLENGQSINMLNKIGDLGSLLEIYEKNNGNGKETVIGRYFLSKENVKDKNSGIGISKGEGKASLFYLKKHESSNKDITTEVINKGDISRKGYIDNAELENRLAYWIKNAPREFSTFVRPNFVKGIFSVSAVDYGKNDYWTVEFKVVAYPKNNMENIKTYTVKSNEAINIPVGEDDSEYVFRFYENRGEYKHIGDFYLNKDNKKEGIGIALSRRDRMNPLDDLEKVYDMPTKMLYVKKGEGNSIKLLKESNVVSDSYKNNNQIQNLLNEWKEEYFKNKQESYKTPNFSKGKLNVISYDYNRQDGGQIAARIAMPNQHRTRWYTPLMKRQIDLIEYVKDYKQDVIIEFIDNSDTIKVPICGSWYFDKKVIGRIHISKEDIGENMYGVSIYKDINGKMTINYLENKGGKVKEINPTEIAGNKSQQELEKTVTNWITTYWKEKYGEK